MKKIHQTMSTPLLFFGPDVRVARPECCELSSKINFYNASEKPKSKQNELI
jgi:hypothetical protein